MPRPNVVIMTCHDLGDHISPYGTPVDSPNLARVAAEGCTMLNHCSTGSVCSPSRGSIVTGCYPHTHGLMGLVHRGWALNVDACPPLPRLLADAGYDTQLFGFQHEHRDWRPLGYAGAPPTPSHHVEEVVPVFTDWLRTRIDDRPFLAAIGYGETHRMGLKPSHFRRDVYTPAEPADVRVPPYLPDIPEIRRDLADFYGAVNLVDRMVGRVLGTLDELGLSEDTLFIFTSDHGFSFIHAKATLYDGGCKVALLMRRPGTLPAGRRVQTMTSHVDVLPTVLEMAAVPVPGHVQGRSMLPALTAPESAPATRQYAFAEKNYTNYYDPTRMARDERLKYIRKGLRTCVFDFVIPEIELCPSDFRSCRAVSDFYSARRTTEELFDLDADPGELDNLADDPAWAGQLGRMRAALDTHLEATDDPFGHLRNGLTMPEMDYTALRGRERRD